MNDERVGGPDPHDAPTPRRDPVPVLRRLAQGALVLVAVLLVVHLVVTTLVNRPQDELTEEIAPDCTATPGSQHLFWIRTTVIVRCPKPECPEMFDEMRFRLDRRLNGWEQIGGGELELASFTSCGSISG